MIRTSQRTDLFYGVLLQSLLMGGDLKITIVPLENGYQVGVTNVQGFDVAMNFDNAAIENSNRNAAVMAVAEAGFIKDRLVQLQLNAQRAEQEKAAADEQAEKEKLDFAKAKKATKKKPAAKKKSTKKTAAKKTTAKKSTAKKAAPKKAPAKKAVKKVAPKVEEPANDAPAEEENGKPVVQRKVVKTADNVLS